MITLQVMNDAADPKREQDIYVDPDYVNAMAEWLIDQQNKTSGSWSEISEIYDMKLMVSDYFVKPCFKNNYKEIGLSIVIIKILLNPFF